MLLPELKDLIAQFKDYLIFERKLSPNSTDSYQLDVKQFYLFLQQQNSFQSLEACFELETLDQYIIWLYHQNLKARSVLRKLSSLSTFIKFLKNEGLIKHNHSSFIDRPKAGERLPHFLEIAEIERFIKHFALTKPEGIRDRALFELLYSCGLRVSEATSLDLNDLYLQESLVKILGKGNKERLVPVGERAKNELIFYLKNARPLLLKKQPSIQAVFLNYRGQRLTRKGIWKNLKIAANLCGIKKKFTIHTLRHSFATHLLQNGADIRGVQVLLGHKSINTTEIYTHLNLEHIKKTYQKFHSHS